MYSDPVLSLAPASATQRIGQRDPQPNFRHGFAVLGHLGSKGFFFSILLKYHIGANLLDIFIGKSFFFLISWLEFN
jgi:hypothetical protein